MTRKHWIRLLNAVLVTVVLFFVGRELVTNWSQVVAFDWTLHPFWLPASIVMHLATLAMMSWVWCWLIGAYGHSVRLIDAFAIAYLTNLGRYVPGKIWPVFGMAYLAKTIGIQERESVSSWIVALLYANIASLIVGLVLIITNSELLNLFRDWAGPERTQIFTWVVVAALIAGTIVVIIPKLVESVIHWILARLKRDAIDLQITFGRSVTVLLGYVVGWTLYGISFWMLIKGVAGGVELPLVVAIATFVVSYQIGYLALFAPAGAGVREIVMVLFLEPYIGEAAIGVAIVARLWNLVVEMLAAFVSLRLPLSRRVLFKASAERESQ